MAINYEEKNFEILRITNGEEEFDFLKYWCLEAFNRSVANRASAAVYAENPMADYRRLVIGKMPTITDTWTFTASDIDEDALAEALIEYRDYEGEALSYWDEDRRFQDRPWYVVYKSRDETNIRFALIRSISSPSDGDIRKTVPIPIIQNWDLIIEHDAWQDVIHGDALCATLGIEYSSSAYPFALGYPNSNSVVNCSNDFSVTNLSLGDMTIDGWVKIDNTVSGEMVICSKGQTVSGHEEGWIVEANVLAPGNPVYLRFIQFFNGGVDAISTITDIDIGDGEWHHFACAWSVFSPITQAQFYIDGVAATMNHVAPVGSPYPDNGFDIELGNNVNGQGGRWLGLMGWTRLSNGKRWTAAFDEDVPPLCELPVADVSTKGIWIYEGEGTTAENTQGNTNLDGSLLNGPVWYGTGCSFETALAEECGEWLPIRNAFVFPLTHAYYEYNAGTLYSGNLLESVVFPYDLFEDVAAGPPAVGDCHYCINANAIFNNVFFNIGRVSSNLTYTVEYYNGAWVSLSGAVTVIDTIGNFDTLGIVYIVFDIPSDWIMSTINGVTGYMIRWRITTAVPVPIIPQQAEYPEYSANENALQVSESFLCDLDPLSNWDFSALSFDLGNNHGVSRVIGGLRSVSRGADFHSLLNLSDAAPRDSVLTLPQTNAVWFDDAYSPSGRCIRGLTDGTLTEFPVASIQIQPSLVPDYFGKFRFYMRFRRQNADIAYLWAEVFYGIVITVDRNLLYRTPKILVDSTYDTDKVYTFDGPDNVVDVFGSAFPYAAGETTADWLTIILWMQNVTGATFPAIHLYDVALIPADEGIFDTGTGRGLAYLTDDYYTSIGSTEIPREIITSKVQEKANENQNAGFWDYEKRGFSTVDRRSNQKLHCLFTHLNDATTNNRRTELHAVEESRLEVIKRYNSARGRY